MKEISGLSKSTLEEWIKRPDFIRIRCLDMPNTFPESNYNGPWLHDSLDLVEAILDRVKSWLKITWNVPRDLSLENN